MANHSEYSADELEYAEGTYEMRPICRTYDENATFKFRLGTKRWSFKAFVWVYQGKRRCNRHEKVKVVYITFHMSLFLRVRMCTPFESLKRNSADLI